MNKCCKYCRFWTKLGPHTYNEGCCYIEAIMNKTATVNWNLQRFDTQRYPDTVASDSCEQCELKSPAKGMTRVTL